MIFLPGPVSGILLSGSLIFFSRHDLLLCHIELLNKLNIINRIDFNNQFIIQQSF